MQTRILAIDLRSQLFGFAVFDGPEVLVHFGRRVWRTPNGPNAVMVLHKRVAYLMTFFLPSAIILKHTAGRNDREVLDRRAAVEIIKHEATLRSTTLVVLGRKEIYEAFRQSGASSKNEIAQLVSEKFLEVAWKLPPKRKNWQPEHHNMAIFDAISLGLAYLANVDRGSTEIERANQEIN